MSRRTFVGIQGRGQIVLPTDIRRRHHLDEEGAQVEVVERDDGVIELRPHFALPADQAWFWQSEWQQAEQIVDTHVAAGEVTVSEDVDDFLDDLDRVRAQSETESAGR